MDKYFGAMLNDLVSQGMLECYEDDRGYLYYIAPPITVTDLIMTSEAKSSVALDHMNHAETFRISW